MKDTVGDNKGNSITVKHIINSKDVFYRLSSTPDIIYTLFDDHHSLDEAVYQCIADMHLSRCNE